MGDATLLVGEWLPDFPQNNNPGVNTATNVLPATPQSYVPVPSFQRGATTALPSTPLGAFAAKDSSGNPAVYTGTTTDLYVSTNSTKPNFENVSATSGGYSVPAGYEWSFDIFNGEVYASNGVDALQSAPVATSTKFSAVDTNAPKAKVIKTIQPGFLLCGNINDVTAGIQPQGVRWSALGGASNGNWPLVGSQAAISAESDWQAVQGANGELKAIAANLPTCNAALFFEDAVFRMIYTGDSNIFDINPVEKVRGTLAGASVVELGAIAYYLSRDGFYAFDGTLSVPIGRAKFDGWFFRNADPNYISRVQGVADPLNGFVYWAFAGTGNSGGIPNCILAYNTVLQRASFLNGFVGSNPLVGLGFGTTLDGIDALGYNVDTLPFSLDSNVLAGGTPFLAGFDAANYFGYFTGPNLAFSVETTEKRLVAAKNARIRGVRPLVEGGQVTAAVGSRATLDVAASYASATAPDREGICPARSDARYQRAMLTGVAGNTVSSIMGAEIVVSKGGSH